MLPLRSAGAGCSHVKMMAVELTAIPDAFKGAPVGTAHIHNIIDSKHGEIVLGIHSFQGLTRSKRIKKVHFSEKWEQYHSTYKPYIIIRFFPWSASHATKVIIIFRQSYHATN